MGIKENDILVCISDYMDNYRLMFEKGKEYMVNLTENYFWISSEFYKGYELKENLLKYFKPKEINKEIKVGDKVRAKSTLFDDYNGECMFENDKVYDVLASDNSFDNRHSIRIKDETGNIRKFSAEYFELVEEKTDSIVEDVINQFRKRSKVGIEKYGTTLNDNNTDDFLEHTKQELMDAVNYIQKLQTQRKDNIIQKVKEFNKAFGIPYSIVPTLNNTDKLLRFKLMQEENTEYLEAETIEDVADALGDQLYVLIGTILNHGLQDVIFDVFNEIHESNMSKLEDGKALHREDGKILKGKNYFKPNLKQFFK